MRRLLVIEDGFEYLEFARTFLAEHFTVERVGSGAEAQRFLSEVGCDAMLLDLRFDRAPDQALIGDLEATARRLFAGDRERALRYLKEEQGTLILASLRELGHRQQAVFVHDFAPRRLENLRKLYGEVAAVPSFDAAAIRKALLHAPT